MFSREETRWPAVRANRSAKLRNHLPICADLSSLQVSVGTVHYEPTTSFECQLTIRHWRSSRHRSWRIR